MKSSLSNKASAIDELLAGGPAAPPAPKIAAPSAGAAANVPLEELEPLVVRGEWQAVLKRLGPAESAGELPPKLALIHALAQKESSEGADDTRANLLGIRAIAALLGTKPESQLALNIAKRLLRRNPIAWRQRKAPKAPIRIAVVVVALAGGSVVGWLAGPGGDMFMEIIEMMMR